MKITYKIKELIVLLKFYIYIPPNPETKRDMIKGNKVISLIILKCILIFLKVLIFLILNAYNGLFHHSSVNFF